jgi:hypothetical protein
MGVRDPRATERRDLAHHGIRCGLAAPGAVNCTTEVVHDNVGAAGGE